MHRGQLDKTFLALNIAVKVDIVEASYYLKYKLVVHLLSSHYDKCVMRAEPLVILNMIDIEPLYPQLMLILLAP